MRPPFNLYWQPREPNFAGIDTIVRINNVVWALQFTISGSHRSAIDGLELIRENMGHKRGVEWRLVIVGPDLTEAKFARDHHDLGGRWEATRIYACELPLGNLSENTINQLVSVHTLSTFRTH